MDGLVHIAELAIWIRKSKRIASELVDKEHERLVKGGEVGMIATERVINDLNVSKLMLCNPQVLTPEMCVKIGQAINGAIDLLKENKPQSVISDRQHEKEPGYWERKGFCPKCYKVVFWMANREYCGFCGQAVKWDD